MSTEKRTMTRRELLKRGALAGGAVLWATPVVQVVGMAKAHARDVSPNCTRVCLKWEVDDNEPTGELTCAPGAQPIWTNDWENLGKGKANVLTCPDDSVDDLAVAQDLTTREDNEFVVYGSKEMGFWVAFPDDVKVAFLEDEADPYSGGVKCNGDTAAFTKSELDEEPDPCFDDYVRVFLPVCKGGKDISHIELIVDWCPGA